MGKLVNEPSVTPDEVLAFIIGYSDMPNEEWRARWPEWVSQVDRAHKRYNAETGGGLRRCADLMVNNHRDAIYSWVFLPLMRLAQGGRGDG